MVLDVRRVHTVVHFGPANDVDDYLQESGRAGRYPAVKCMQFSLGISTVSTVRGYLMK